MGTSGSTSEWRCDHVVGALFSPPMRLTPKTANIVALALTALGCLQMIGFLTGVRSLRGIGAALALAPFPKVFSDVDGLETFASSFELQWTDAHGRHRLAITPELYSRLKGAYNRRNVYGAALSYGPRLPEPLWQAVFCYAFGPQGPLRREFGLGPEARDIAVQIRTNTKGRFDQWTLQPSCNE
jgi:hypothetical protein